MSHQIERKAPAIIVVLTAIVAVTTAQGVNAFEVWENTRSVVTKYQIQLESHGAAIFIKYDSPAPPKLYWNAPFLLEDKRKHALPSAPKSSNSTLFSLQDIKMGSSTCLDLTEEYTNITICSLLLHFPVNESAALHTSAFYVFHFRKVVRWGITDSILLPSSSRALGQNYTTTSEMLARLAHPLRGASMRLADHCDLDKNDRTEASYRDLKLQVVKPPVQSFNVNYTLWRCPSYVTVIDQRRLVSDGSRYCYVNFNPYDRIQNPNECAITALLSTEDSAWGYLLHESSSSELVLYDSDSRLPQPPSGFQVLLWGCLSCLIFITIFVCVWQCDKLSQGDPDATPRETEMGL